ncbi:MAG: HD domain-containing protein [Anaerolineae bacterium]
MQVIDVEQARKYYDESDSAHDFHHVLRVLYLAERIGTAEGADMEILRTAALLHDIGRPDEIRDGVCHAQVGGEKARQILVGWPGDKVEAVAHAIATHRFRRDVAPRTLEAKVLYDADKLDSIGATGVARAYAIGGLMGQRLWAEVQDDYVLARRENKELARGDLSSDHTPVHEFAFKLSQIKDTLFTGSAREIAEDRHRFMAEFFRRLEAEVNGEA